MKDTPKKAASTISGYPLGIALAALLVMAPPVCRAGGVPTAHPPPAPHVQPVARPHFDIGEFQMRRNQLRRHLNGIRRRQWAMEACRKKHPPKTKARAKCLAKARDLSPG